MKKELPIDVRWPVDRFDFKAGVCRPRFDGDQECEDNNIIIRRELGKCNEIFRYYRLADLPITITRFYRDYKSNLSKSNFVQYMEGKIRVRHCEKEISGETMKKHMVTWRKLNDYNSDLLFADFDERWCQDWDNWLKRNIRSRYAKQSQNSRWSHHKVIKVYMNLAKRDKIKFTYPYEWFSIGMVKGRWHAIFESEVKLLYDYYANRLDKKCPDNYRTILRAFLFACMTGLRISDLIRITAGNVMDDILVFVPYKTRKQNYLHKVPLNKMARKLFDDAADCAMRPQVFYSFSEPYSNRTLKDIAGLVGIDKNLHWHIARHTFISLYYSKTKDLLMTKEFAGHKSVAQTMIYTHQNPAEIKEKMKPMDDIF